MCKCIEKVNRQLEEIGCNTRLDVPLVLNLKTGRNITARIKLAVVKADTGNRERLKTLLATYCPICGVKYADKKRKDGAK